MKRYGFVMLNESNAHELTRIAKQNDDQVLRGWHAKSGPVGVHPPGRWVAGRFQSAYQRDLWKMISF